MKESIAPFPSVSSPWILLEAMEDSLRLHWTKNERNINVLVDFSMLVINSNGFVPNTPNESCLLLSSVRVPSVFSIDVDVSWKCASSSSGT
jgi:hypothetical protein